MFAEAWHWLLEFLFAHRSEYVGRHFAETVERVAPDYHPGLAQQIPGACQYRELWKARIERRTGFKWLVVAPRFIPRFTDWRLVQELKGWNWLDVPSDEWPTVWRNA